MKNSTIPQSIISGEAVRSSLEDPEKGTVSTHLGNPPTGQIVSEHETAGIISITNTSPSEDPPTTSSPHLIDWDGPSDPQKPLNWTSARKFKNIVVICYCTFLTPLGSTMFAPALTSVTQTFNNTNPLLSSFSVSVWILGYFFGPLFIAPLSELYGRLPIYIACNTLFTIFNIATAVSPSFSALILFRFLAGTFGGCPITIGAGTFGDLIKPASRGKVIAIWSVGPILGPILGPIAGGYLGEDVGWRWICWVLSIAAGVGAFASALLQEETYPPTLLERKARRLRLETGDAGLKSALSGEKESVGRVFARSIVRPLRLLFLSPIVASLSLFQGVSYGFMYLLFTTFPIVFRDQYGFRTGTVGLTYVGMGIGSILSVIVGGWWTDHIFKTVTRSGKRPFRPEDRLPPLVWMCFALPVGLFWYGWAVEKKTHWIVPIAGTVWTGIGTNMLMMSISTYLIDAHPLYEASATAAATSVRSLIGALVPLAGRSMYETLGLGWGNSLLGFLALAMCPLPWIFYTYGERIRTNQRLKL
ncbi:benomyl/methotrexate resistance protein [Dendryphion nanum]|uniref:Benomyl/methotrexate resistance protein n=1 Tax=Dendryphion nanum TaxID=256645 RepID=A0A9P9J2C7_9PLEO|nr:benomyl/methotrexate resistance protein [Dendryphion nanum]